MMYVHAGHKYDAMLVLSDQQGSMRLPAVHGVLSHG